jgi:hypothetical protein
MKLTISSFSKQKIINSYIYLSLRGYSEKIGPHWYNEILIYKR